MNLSLEELKNIKIILFSHTRTVQIAKFPEISPEISHLLTNSAVTQELRNLSIVNHKTKSPFGAKFLIHHESKICSLNISDVM